MHEVSTTARQAPSWASVLILMHSTGCYSLMAMPALFHLPEMPFLTFIHLENSYSSLKTSSGFISIPP